MSIMDERYGGFTLTTITKFLDEVANGQAAFDDYFDEDDCFNIIEDLINEVLRIKASLT